MEKKKTITLKRRHLRLALALIALSALAIPTAAWASHRFSDVPTTNVFHDDISWLADAGVTKGCNPPDNTNFCPADTVTRQTMAAFLRRLAENQVVDARTAVSADSATNAAHATTADSAATAEIADNSDTIDGFDSAHLVQAFGTSRTDVLEDVTSNVNLVTLDIDAPVDGLLAITAVADLEQHCGQGTSGIRGDTVLRVDGVTAVSVQETRDLCEAPYDMAYAATATATAVVEVTAGTHIVDFDWKFFSGTMWSSAASITAIFTPFGDAGGLALASGAPAAQNPAHP